RARRSRSAPPRSPRDSPRRWAAPPNDRARRRERARHATTMPSCDSRTPASRHNLGPCQRSRKWIRGESVDRRLARAPELHADGMEFLFEHVRLVGELDEVVVARFLGERRGLVDDRDELRVGAGDRCRLVLRFERRRHRLQKLRRLRPERRVAEHQLGQAAATRLNFDGARAELGYRALLALLHVHHRFAEDAQRLRELLLLLERVLELARRAADRLFALELGLAERVGELLEAALIVFDRLRSGDELREFLGHECFYQNWGIVPPPSPWGATRGTSSRHF